MANSKKNLFLGIELGSTRIKSVLIEDSNNPAAGADYKPIALGSHDWENRLENDIWTYSIQDIWHGLQASYKAMAAGYEANHGKKLTTITGIGISAMMHGYLPLDCQQNPLSEFRTWRNTSTVEASAVLTPLFGINIPLRWSISHLYQAILNGESHISQISTITTLAGYVHFILTGQNILGVSDASGVFPIDSTTCRYHTGNIAAFDNLIANKSYPWKLADILPKVLPAGAKAGRLTPNGAKLLDPTGNLNPGVPLCPPEGDAGTGMVATNSIAAGTGNISAGTSIFAMLVLEKGLTKMQAQIDMVATPDGKPVAMVHCNNGTSDLNAWVELFHSASNIITCTPANISNVYESLYRAALEGDPNGGGLMAVNYLSGEHNTGFEEGRPLFMRLPNANFTIHNFMRTMLFSSMATLKLGLDILIKNEGVKITQLMGHGGLFATKGVAQKLMAGALNIPVTVMETASEGGAWGIALLAAYMSYSDITLDKFLTDRVFSGWAGSTQHPESADTQGFASFMKHFAAGLKVERTAVDNFN